jgi:DNA-binding transcriptional MerR regulator
MENSKLYYSIGEVAQMLNVAPSVLRFWETEFDCIHPVKNRRGTRSYTAHDIELLRRIHYLTRECGYTLEGAREQLRQKPIEDTKMEIINNLHQLRSFLVDLKDQL